MTGSSNSTSAATKPGTNLPSYAYDVNPLSSPDFPYKRGPNGEMIKKTKEEIELAENPPTLRERQALRMNRLHVAIGRGEGDVGPGGMEWYYSEKEKLLKEFEREDREEEERLKKEAEGGEGRC